MRFFFARILLIPMLATGLAVPLPAAASTHSTVAHRNGAPSDEQIESTLHARLAKSKVGKDGFRFHVQRGVVTWEGTTNVMQHKGAATRMAKAAGATQVVNNIQVGDAAKARAGSNLKKAYVQQ